MRKCVYLILFGICFFAGVVGMVAPVWANEKEMPANAPAPAVTNPKVSSNEGAQVDLDPNVSAVIPSDSFDFGSVFEGNEVFHNFIIKNEGTSTLKILSVKSG